MLKIFDNRGTYTVEKLESDGSTSTLTITGVRPDALTPEAFRDACGKAGAEVKLKQSIGKLKENGIRFSATMKELYGTRAIAAANDVLAPMLPSPKLEAKDA